MSRQTISFTRAGKKHIFSYTPGKEKEVIKRVLALAGKSSGVMDVLDAVTICCGLVVSADRDTPPAAC